MGRYRCIKGHPLILAADLNSLKHINDTFGNARGDEAIMTVAIGWYQEQGEGVDKAFNQADSLMYQNKPKKA